jgi:heme-degrading monooxygenase HmoA
MITEIAQIDVKPGTEKDFEAAVAKASAVPACQGWQGL